MPVPRAGAAAKELFKQYRYLQRILKYERGLDKMPGEYRAQYARALETLMRRVGTHDLATIEKRLDDLEQEIEALATQPPDRQDQSPQNDLRAVVNERMNRSLRLLLGHLTSPRGRRKAMTLLSVSDGIYGMPKRPMIFLPSAKEPRNGITGREFEAVVMAGATKWGWPDISVNAIVEAFEPAASHPLPLPDHHPPTLIEPVLHYNCKHYWSELQKGKPSIVLTGACLISGIPDEFTMVLDDGSQEVLQLNYTPVTDLPETFQSLCWPERPILGDLLGLLETIAVARIGTDTGNCELRIWIPLEDYITEYCDYYFAPLLAQELLSETMIRNELENLARRYEKLIGWVLEEVWFEGSYRILQMDEQLQHHFRGMSANLGLDARLVKYRYGAWRPQPVIIDLYHNLILQHMMFSYHGKNTLVVENSYELWPNIHASILAKHQAVIGTYSWLLHTTPPALNFLHPRDFNAPSAHKIFLGGSPASLEQQLERMQNTGSEDYKRAITLPLLRVYDDDPGDCTPDQLWEWLRELIVKANAVLQT